MDIINVVKNDREPVIDKRLAPNNTPRTVEVAPVSTSQTISQDISSASSVSATNTNNVSAADNSSQVQETKHWEPQSLLDLVTSAFEEDESAILSELKARNEAERSAEAEAKREEALAKAKEEIAALNQKQLSLRFDTSNDFDDTNVINVVDAKSNEIIRQIPSEEFLRIAASIRQYEQRVEQNNMVTDPQLKAKGLSAGEDSESLRGAVFDDVV